MSHFDVVDTETGKTTNLGNTLTFSFYDPDHNMCTGPGSCTYMSCIICMGMYTCVDMICVHARMHTHTRMHMHAHEHMRAYARIHTHTHTIEVHLQSHLI